ncbi:hypothetical protein [Maribacter stanieri]|uniref:hypothetical protein n=1 Tax=Maribacter stanieri TaxID=440514 RepID=UPI002494E0E1|nr:hypothetical protein [Maribacter stanieri]|tara:strand:+ start:26 stop:376 length:351 start_codon:yes stop_codon:yes gene_type:complete
MNQTIDIRYKPTAKIIFSEDKFEIIDTGDESNNGIYLLDNLLNFDVIEKRTNWFITILSFAVDIFTGSGSGGSYKNKAYLKIDLENRNIKIWLSNEDIAKANIARELLTEAILKKN